MAATWGDIGLGLLQGVALIGGAPLMVGFLRWFKARWQGYQAPSPAQPYRDIAKLLRMSSVRPEKASVVFGATPYLLFALYGAVACAIPIFARQALLNVDLILLIYLLALARFVLSLAGLDVGASFGGLGSSREMFFHFLTEIGLAVFVAGLAIRWRTTDLAAILQAHWGLGLVQFAYHPDLVLLALAFGFLVLFEMERIPLDNPATHLELTMTHRAIMLEFAGRDLAVLEWAEMVKVATLLTLFGALFLSFPTALSPFRNEPNAGLTAAVSAFFRTVVLVVGLAGWELVQPKLRLRAVTGPALTAIVLSLTAILYGITLGR
jgi:formate hydrogenlyase subunit 4